MPIPVEKDQEALHLDHLQEELPGPQSLELVRVLELVQLLEKELPGGLQEQRLQLFLGYPAGVPDFPPSE